MSLTILKENVITELSEKITELRKEQFDFLLSISSSPSKGDIVIAIGKLNKIKNIDIKSIKDKIIDVLKSVECISNIDVHQHFINIYFKESIFVGKVLNTFYSDINKSLGNKPNNGLTLYIDYSSPNIAKPFHIGHLRSTIIGSFITNLHKKLGYNVVSENYLGDWGKQYGLLGLAFELYGSEEELKKNCIKHLFELYVKINQEKKLDETIDERAKQYFKSLEDGDVKKIELWKTMREMSIIEYKKMYKKLGIEFDIYGGESLHRHQVEQHVNYMNDNDLLTEQPDGSKIINLEPYNLGKTIILKQDGATKYITRDIAAVNDRWEKYHFDKMYYVVAIPQTLHFQQLFKILELCGKNWVNRCKHLSFGMVDGMSTRKGNIVFLSDVIDEAKRVMLKQMENSEKTKINEIENPEKISEIIGLSAIFISDLSSKKIKNYEFTWDTATTFEGDTGPYIQYTHSRLCGIERKAMETNNWNVQQIIDNDQFNSELLSEKECKKVAWYIDKYPDVVMLSYNNLEACNIVQYMFGLCHAISSANSVLNVIHSPEPIGKSRLVLFHAAKVVLNDAIKLLGLTPVEKM